MRRLAPGIVSTVVLLAACGSGHHAHASLPATPASSAAAPQQTVRTRSAVGATTTTSFRLGGDGVAGATAVRSILVSGVVRSYRLYSPAALGTARRAPLIVVLHGASGNAARVELRYHWDPLAATHHFFVVYPQGIDDHWNPSLVPGASDDVSFISDLLDRLVRTLPVDPAHVYVAGMSNGGAMAYRLGCALSSRLAGIAVVEGWNPGCTPTSPVALVAVHGLADEEVAFSRAQGSVAAWRGFDGCSAADRVTQHGLVSVSVWSTCAAHSDVAFYAIAGSGHEWPGASPPLPGHDVPSTALDATAAIWGFFSQGSS